MNGLLVAALTVYAVVGGAATTNELTHGWLAEHMGIGHQHWIDHGGHHCHDGDAITYHNASNTSNVGTPCGHHFINDDRSHDHHHGGGP